MIKPFTEYQRTCTIHTRKKKNFKRKFRAHKRTRIPKRTTSVFHGITFALNKAAIRQIHGSVVVLLLLSFP